MLDGLGVGELPDADRYGDTGSDTLGHTAEAVGGLALPHLQTLGLGNITPVNGVGPALRPTASYGKMGCRSQGKDSTTGHWELGGLVVPTEFPTFPHGFPPELIARFQNVCKVGGVLGNRAASGTQIIQELGDEHIRTGFPIVYTSADSVFQIAAHEEVIPPAALHALCATTREKVCTGEYSVGRVIARPFIGTSGAYTRTTRRRDFSLVPPGPTILNVLQGAGIRTEAVGKIDDLYAGSGIDHAVHTAGNAEGIARTIAMAEALRGGFLMVNLVDFDMLYGHRNDAPGFAAALRAFDDALPVIQATLRPGDVLVLTADHGNDPVTPSTDHSREYVPVLWHSPGRPGVPLGTRASFADLGKTVADFFGVPNTLAGESFLPLVAGQ